VGAGGQSTISFTSIPSTYKHLQIRAISRDTSASTLVNAYMVFNSDTGGNYMLHQLFGDGSSAAASASGTSAVPSAVTSFISTGASSTAGMFGAGIVDILDYADTNKNKTSRILTGTDQNGSGYILFRSNLWRSTAAINRIDINTLGTAFAQYSHFALYGIKG
jgi:hypothetical protein